MDKKRISIAKAVRTIDWMVVKKHSLINKWGDAIREMQEFNDMTREIQASRDMEYTCRICGKHIVMTLKEAVDDSFKITCAIFDMCPECGEQWGYG